MDRLKGLLWGLLVCAVLTLLFGCRSVEHVPVPSVSVDSVYVDRWHRDSVYVRDSVFVNQWVQGDTVYRDRVVMKYAYKDRWRYDTVAVVRTDSVRVPYPVEKELGWWERTKTSAFPLLVATVAVLAFVIVWLARKQGWG